MIDYSIFVITFALILFGTVWGVTRVIIPIFSVAWGTLRVVVIGTLIILPLFTGTWFRLFGYNALDGFRLLESNNNMNQIFRDREENYNLSGAWEPNWRENAGLPPLPKDWNRVSEHKYNPIVSVLVPFYAFALYLSLIHI